MVEIVRIEAPHFVAALMLNELGSVVRAAPIVGYMAGWSRNMVEAYCQKRRWRLTGHGPATGTVHIARAADEQTGEVTAGAE